MRRGSPGKRVEGRTARPAQNSSSKPGRPAASPPSPDTSAGHASSGPRTGFLRFHTRSANYNRSHAHGSAATATGPLRRFSSRPQTGEAYVKTERSLDRLRQFVEDFAPRGSARLPERPSQLTQRDQHSTGGQLRLARLSLQFLERTPSVRQSWGRGTKDPWSLRRPAFAQSAGQSR